MDQYYSHGKLLLAGEYAVLDGVLALAIPTTFGQSLNIMDHDKPGQLHWESYLPDGNLWFSGQFETASLILQQCSDQPIGENLQKLLSSARSLNPEFLTNALGQKAISRLEFPSDWGLGSSSTLINNVAQWAHINPFTLSELSFGGSGYDIAAAQSTAVFTYQRLGTTQKVHPIKLPWTFTQNIYFVYLNKKQDSRKAIERYRSTVVSPMWHEQMQSCVEAMLQVRSMEEIIPLIEHHERLIGKAIGMTPVKKRLFSAYEGVVKSLGGWGGDFVMAIGPDTTPDYFKNLGYHTVISFDDMTQKK